jgi:hypothetical protein
MIDVLGALMGIDMQGFSREEGSEELPPGLSKDPSTPPPPSGPTPTPAQAPPTEDVDMANEDEEEAKEQMEAEAAKKAGSDAYRRREFGEAAKYFQKAWDIWPKDITFLTNLGGTFQSYSTYSFH